MRSLAVTTALGPTYVTAWDWSSSRGGVWPRLAHHCTPALQATVPPSPSLHLGAYRRIAHLGFVPSSC